VRTRKQRLQAVEGAATAVYTALVRVFLDIGSHMGETILEAQQAKYGFDRIVCFEPASPCWPALQAIARKDPRVEICKFGLGREDGTIELHNPGNEGASIINGEGPVEEVQIVDAAAWFRDNLHSTDFIVAKTNCEGAEVAIINRLLDADLFGWAVTFLVTFDIRHFPEHRGEEAKLRARLRRSGLRNFCFSDDVMIGTTHQRRIAHWLHLFGIDSGEGRPEVERTHAANFDRYSRKRGLHHRWEHALKDRFGYSALPEPIKAVLRSSKRRLGFTRERDVEQT
jgi:FkbM family methyltransferase